MKRRLNIPGCVNKFLYFNEIDRMRDGFSCSCPDSERKYGVHHGIYQGEKPIPHCIPNSK